MTLALCFVKYECTFPNVKVLIRGYHSQCKLNVQLQIRHSVKLWKVHLETER